MRVMLFVGFLGIFCTEPSALTIEDFEEFDISREKEPAGTWTVEYDRGSTIVQIVTETDPLLSAGESKVLRITGTNNSYSIAKTGGINGIAARPLFSWKWKVTKYPEGARISDLKLDDSAAQVYINFSLGCRYLWYPCVFSICYFYGTTINPPETFLWSGYGTYVKFITVRSVEMDGVGAWYREERNVLEDYRAAIDDFLNHDNRKVREKFASALESANGETMLPFHSVAIWVDSNDTKSSAESYYDDLIFRSLDTADSIDAAR